MMTPYATPKHTLSRRARAAAVAALVLAVSAPHAQAQAAPAVTEAEIEAVSGTYGTIDRYAKEVQAGTLSFENYQKLVAIRNEAADHIDEMAKRDFGHAGLSEDGIVRILGGHMDELNAAAKAKSGAGLVDATLQTANDTLNQVALPTQTEVTIIVSSYVEMIRTLIMARAAMPNGNAALLKHDLELIDEAQRVLANRLYIERQQLEKDADSLAHMPASEKAELAAKIQDAMDKGDIYTDANGNVALSSDLKLKMIQAKIASNGSSRGSNGSVVNGNGTGQSGGKPGGTGSGSVGSNGASPARSTTPGTGTANAGTSTGNGDPAFSAGNGAGNGQASNNGSGDGVNSTATAGGQGSGYSSGGGTGSERPVLYVTTSTNGIPDSIPAMVNGRWTLVNNPASPRNAQNGDSPPGYLVDGDQAGGEDGLNALLAEANAVSSGLNSAMAGQDAGPVSVTLAPIYTCYRVVPGDNGSSVIAVTSTQVQVPTAVMTVPSTQINVPSPVMTSLDLYPALCGS